MAKKNYNYGKMENGNLVYAPNKLIVPVTNEDGTQRETQVFNASTYVYGLQGWLPIIRTEQPEATENGYYASAYTQLDGQIVQSWEFREYYDNEAV